MKNVWLIGAGPMARDYIKVLENLSVNYITIGRGEESAKLAQAISSKPVVSGGLSDFLLTNPELPTHAIVAVPVQNLFECAKELLSYGVKEILIEKPAGIDKAEIIGLNELSEKSGASIVLAYNRRFYASVIEAQRLIAEDGGITSCHFEFTEWSHVIETLNKAEEVFQHWFLGNSTHVVDLAFYLIGAPKQLSAIVAGSLAWHKAGSVFCGAGSSVQDIPFSYHANWAAPGRWSVEVMTAKRRFVFKPMEELRVIKLGSVKEEVVEINDLLDKTYKPGLYLETQKFLEGCLESHCSLNEQANILDFYYKMANYC